MSKEILHNESKLVAALQAGNQEAFTTLYRYYSPRLYLNILRFVKDVSSAEEMVQELFTRVWQYRHSSGMTENFSGYLYRLAQNLVYDFFRKLKKDQDLMKKFMSLAEDGYNDIEDKVQYQQTTVILNDAIEQLSPQQKTVYKLVKVEGLTYKKAAELMKISSFTVKEYLVNANKSIRSYVMHHGDNAMNLCCLLFIDLLISGIF